MKKTKRIELNLELGFNNLSGIDKLKKTLCLLVLPFVLFLTSCALKPTPIPELITAEEYQVYHDLLLENPDMWNIPPGTEIMVFFDQTYVRHDPETVRSILGNKSSLTEELIDHFLVANQRTQSLEDQFALGIPVIFVENNTVQNLVRGLEFAEQCEFSLQAVYPKPRYGGFYYLSRVGFDQQMNTALLYIEHSICGGSGNFLVLEKEADTWKVKDFAIGLQSDLGLAMPAEMIEEEYLVYNSLLNASNAFGLGSDYQFITIFDQTILIEENLSTLIQEKQLDTQTDLVNNLVSSSTSSFHLSPRGKFELPLVMVAWKEFETLWKGDNEESCTLMIQERLPPPKFQGWFRFSRVGFNQEKDKALVYIELNACKTMGFIVLLEKQNESWYIQDYDIVQIST